MEVDDACESSTSGIFNCVLPPGAINPPCSFSADQLSDPKFQIRLNLSYRMEEKVVLRLLRLSSVRQACCFKNPSLPLLRPARVKTLQIQVAASDDLNVLSLITHSVRMKQSTQTLMTARTRCRHGPACGFFVRIFSACISFSISN